MSDASEVLKAIDQLRRDLSGYHGQLVAHNDMQRHCDNQRKRIVELEAIHARDKDENAKLREFATLAWQVLTRNEPLYVWQGMVNDARELGIEVE